jgi:hypothetical protein
VEKSRRRRRRKKNAWRDEATRTSRRRSVSLRAVGALSVARPVIKRRSKDTWFREVAL